MGLMKLLSSRNTEVQFNKSNFDFRWQISTADSSLIQIYTDGACIKNPGRGGWAAILLFDDNRKELSGGHSATTNNRMELTAAIEALASLESPTEVEVYSDSKYLVQGMTEWMANWKRRGWQRHKRTLKNLDLWLQLDKLDSIHKVTWRWIKGHAGNEMNEAVDKLASQAIP